MPLNVLTRFCRWERRLNQKLVPGPWEFCKATSKGLVQRAEELQSIARQLILESFLKSGADVAELETGVHVFSRHFKPTATGHRQVTGLQALAADAHQAQSKPDEFMVAFPPVTEVVQAQHWHNYPSIQGSNGIVQTAVDGSAVGCGYHSLHLNGQSVTAMEQHSGACNNRSLQQREVSGNQGVQPQSLWNTASQTVDTEWFAWAEAFGDAAQVVEHI